MSKQKLKVQDLKRALYWFHLAFKEKEPSNEDGKTLKMILRLAECDRDLVQEQMTSYDPSSFEDE